MGRGTALMSISLAPVESNIRPHHAYRVVYLFTFQLPLVLIYC